MTGRHEERTSFSHRTIFTGIVVSLLGVFAIGFYVYVRHVRFTPTATSHLPEGAELVVRLDVEQGVVFGPFRHFFMDLVERGRLEGESRAKYLERRASLELAVDAREVVFAELPQGQWLIVVGGVFDLEGVMDVIGQMLAEEGIELQREGSLLLHASGVGLGATADGNLVMASSAELLRRSLVGRQDARLEAPFAVDSEEKLALSIWKGRNNDGTRQPYGLNEGYLRIGAAEGFPTKGHFLTREQELSLLTAGGLIHQLNQSFSYFASMGTLKLRLLEHGEFEVSGDLGEVEFAAAVERLADSIGTAVNSSLNLEPFGD